MDFEQEFENIRPYNNSELQPAIDKIIADKNFDFICEYLFPNKEKKDVISILKSIKTIDEFQLQFSNKFFTNILNETSNGLSSSGIEQIKGKGHLFIANHRDIVLDSALLQLTLVDNNISTTQITVGDNLTKNPLFKELGKLNKMFILYRGGTKIQMYKNAVLHSKYIHNLVREKNESLWIAQRDGRTKDGNDKTQQGLLKMLLGDRRDIVQALKELDIVPMSISYELETCFTEKIKETYISQHTEYKKEENEDMHCVVAGFFSNKNRIHIAFGTPINKIINDIDEDKLSNNEIIDVFVKEIDKQIYFNYMLWTNNYIAWDLLNKKQDYTDKYTEEDKASFEKYIAESIKDIDGNKNQIREIALGIYANPVSNKLSVK